MVHRPCSRTHYILSDSASSFRGRNALAFQIVFASPYPGRTCVEVVQGQHEGQTAKLACHEPALFGRELHGRTRTPFEIGPFWSTSGAARLSRAVRHHRYRGSPSESGIGQSSILNRIGHCLVRALSRSNDEGELLHPAPSQGGLLEGSSTRLVEEFHVKHLLTNRSDNRQFAEPNRRNDHATWTKSTRPKGTRWRSASESTLQSSVSILKYRSRYATARVAHGCSERGFPRAFAGAVTF